MRGRASGYDDIRAGLRLGFSITLLIEVTKICNDMLGADVPMQHPSAAYALALTSQKIVSYWEGQLVREDIAAVIEAHIRPRMEAVIAAAEGEPAVLVAALDDLARAYMDTLPFLKSIGT